MPTVLFDDECKLCRMLAGYAERRVAGSMRFMSWQNYFANGSDSADNAMFKNEAVVLRVLDNGSTLDGPMAWSWLLQQFPDLSALNWLAEKLGLHMQTARALEKAGRIARRLCQRCRPGILMRS